MSTPLNNNFIITTILFPPVPSPLFDPIRVTDTWNCLGKLYFIAAAIKTNPQDVGLQSRNPWPTHTHTSSILLTFCVPIATYFISIWREVNCHKQLVARRPHPCRYCCPCRCRCWYWCPSPRLAAISHALSLLLAMFIIYLQYFLIQNEAASLSELLMARQYTTAKC